MSESIIIALSGKRGSGKNTIAQFICDYFGSWSRGKHRMQCAFADLLKGFCIDVLGLKHSQCYGTDEEKNTPTQYMWNKVQVQGFKDKLKYDIVSARTNSEFMTGREVMQIFGTESVRVWFGNVWAEATLRHIKSKGPALAVITDNRFPSEIEAVLGHPRGYIIRLTRAPFEDDHASETSLDNFDWNRERCFVLDNRLLTKEEQSDAVVPFLDKIFRQELGND
ncbi:MAG: hypothetical protein ACXAC5_01165 [Promethearchaeota archaeon]|jgi:hypothetical protein